MKNILSAEDKYEEIKNIVDSELIAGKRDYKSCYKSFMEIVDVIYKER